MSGEGKFDDAIYILRLEEQEEAARVLEDWPKWEPLIKVAGKVDKAAIEFYVQEAIEPRSFEISSRNLRALYATGEIGVEALLEALPDKATSITAKTHKHIEGVIEQNDREAK